MRHFGALASLFVFIGMLSAADKTPVDIKPTLPATEHDKKANAVPKVPLKSFDETLLRLKLPPFQCCTQEILNARFGALLGAQASRPEKIAETFKAIVDGMHDLDLSTCDLPTHPEIAARHLLLKAGATAASLQTLDDPVLNQTPENPRQSARELLKTATQPLNFKTVRALNHLYLLAEQKRIESKILHASDAAMIADLGLYQDLFKNLTTAHKNNLINFHVPLWDTGPSYLELESFEQIEKYHPSALANVFPKTFLEKKWPGFGVSPMSFLLGRIGFDRKNPFLGSQGMSKVPMNGGGLMGRGGYEGSDSEDFLRRVLGRDGNKTDPAKAQEEALQDYRNAFQKVLEDPNNKELKEKLDLQIRVSASDLPPAEVCRARAYLQREKERNLNFTELPPVDYRVPREENVSGLVLKTPQQAPSGDASCLAHGIARALGPLAPKAKVDAYKLFDELALHDQELMQKKYPGEKVDKPELWQGLEIYPEQLRSLLEQKGITVDGKTRKIDSKTTAFTAANFDQQWESLQKDLLAKKTPILYLHHQARVQREDWVNPVPSGLMGHVATLVGHGVDYNPFSGRYEEYALLSDSYSHGGYPVKVPLDVLRDEIMGAVTLESLKK
jgi:hypothetical protein